MKKTPVRRGMRQLNYHHYSRLPLDTIVRYFSTSMYLLIQASK